MASTEAAGLRLSALQVLAGSAAAVTAAVVCSFFGVAGTVIGTAVASVVATVGTALYQHSMRVTSARLHRLHTQQLTRRPGMGEVLASLRRTGLLRPRHLPWKAMGVGTVAVFVVAIGVVTAIEAFTGRPFSALVGGPRHGRTGTTIGDLVRSRPGPASPASPGATQSSTPNRSSPFRSPVLPTPIAPVPSPKITAPAPSATP